MNHKTTFIVRRYGWLPLVMLLGAGCGTVSVSGIQNSVDCAGEGITATFAADVVPVFDDRDCTNSGCHVGSSPAGDLDLSTGDVDALYARLLAANVLDPDTDPSDPLNTVLLAEPFIGLLPHEGGDIFLDFDDNDYEQLYCWVESGAANN